MARQETGNDLSPDLEGGQSSRATRSVYDQRLKQLRTEIKDNRQAIFIPHQPDILYLTGFDGQDSTLLVTARRVLLLTDSRFTQQAAGQCPWVKTILRRGPMADAVAKTAKRLRLTALRFCPQHVTLHFDRQLRKSLAGSKLRLLGCSSLAQTARIIKGPNELAAIGKAVTIAQQAFNWLKGRIKPGITEHRLAAMLEYKIKLLGAQGIAFNTIVACGANSALPHAPVGQDVLAPGKPIILDFGAVVDGYCSDLTRTVVIGRIPQRLGKIYRTVLEAQNQALSILKADLKAKSADKRARDYIRKAGFGKYFGHGLGHGIGLEIHEQPALGPSSDQVLRPGMVVTVEPGIYIPGYGGVRIEDDVLITDTGCRVLSDLDKEVDQIVI